MLNYEVPQDLLKPRVPSGTELDFLEGRCLVSVVGFQFLDTRIRGFPVPFHRSFDEVNLRFYVRRNVDGIWRRGVVFVKEVVPRRAIAWIARWLYNENYYASAMHSEVRPPSNQSPGLASYAWSEKKQEIKLQAEFSGEATPLVEGSEYEFIAEHYWGYTRQRDGSTVEYEVRHPPWRVWNANGARLEGALRLAYGEQFSKLLSGRPHSTLVAEGSGVEVFSGVRLPEDRV